MTFVNEPTGDRKTVAVTIVGGFYLALGIMLVIGIGFVVSINMVGEGANIPFETIAFISLVQGTIALIFGYVGLATVSRWRGWRICLGAIAWGMIAFAAWTFLRALEKASASAPLQPDPNVKIVYIADFIILVMAVLALLAKRRERPFT